MNNNEQRANFGVTIFVFIMAVILMFFAVKQQIDVRGEREQLSQEISEKVVQEVSNIVKESLSKSSEFPDYDSLKRLESLMIIKNFESWTPEAEISSNKVKKVIVVEEGKLSKGYLYIKASLDGKALSKWESIYVKMNNKGGHLFRVQSLPIPKSEKTELLYALDDIPYLVTVPYSEQRIPLRINWFDFFEDGNKVEIITFISSLRPALIEEMILYYECIDSNRCLLAIE